MLGGKLFCCVFSPNAALAEARLGTPGLGTAALGEAAVFEFVGSVLGDAAAPDDAPAPGSVPGEAFSPLSVCMPAPRTTSPLPFSSLYVSLRLFRGSSSLRSILS